MERFLSCHQEFRFDHWYDEIKAVVEEKREFLIREKVLQIYAKTFKSLNEYGRKVKANFFDHLKMQVLAQMQHEQTTLEYRAAF